MNVGVFGLRALVMTIFFFLTITSYGVFVRADIINENSDPERVEVNEDSLFLYPKTNFLVYESPEFEILLPSAAREERVTLPILLKEKEREAEIPETPDEIKTEEKVIKEEESIYRKEELSIHATSTLPLLESLPEDSSFASSTDSLLTRVGKFPFRMFSAFFPVAFGKTNPAKTVSAFLTDPRGNTSELEPVISGEEQRATIRIEKPSRSFKPGKYQLRVEVFDEAQENVLVATKEFTWGVLAINTNKSIYLPGDQASLHMAALDDHGSTICNANLRLTIRPTTGDQRRTTFSTDDGTIQESGKCAGNTVVEMPDYSASYQVRESGIYQMTLTNLDNGYEITDSFEVREDVPFDIERIGPTRIYPVAPYEMKIIVKANEDFEGEISEYVPESFEILNQELRIINRESIILDSVFIIQERGDGEKALIWQKLSLHSGDELQLTYTFDAPDVSPEFYLLGPLRIGSFTEARWWQVAGDAVITWDGGGTTNNWSEAANWSGDTLPTSSDSVIFNASRACCQMSGKSR